FLGRTFRDRLHHLTPYAHQVDGHDRRDRPRVIPKSQGLGVDRLADGFRWPAPRRKRPNRVRIAARPVLSRRKPPRSLNASSARTRIVPAPRYYAGWRWPTSATSLTC